MKYRLANPIIDDEQIRLVEEVLKSKMLVHGDKCELFEKKIGNYLKIDKENVAVTSSCTASLHLAILALGIKSGEGVLVPNFTFPATVNAVEVVGAVPIFVDVEPEYYTMDPQKLEEAILNWSDKVKLKAIIVVHEFGAAADMVKISEIAQKHQLFIIEDAACAFGTKIDNQKVGLLSDIGCFSFHPRKAITTGEGGAVVSNNTALIDTVKILRNHGMKSENGRIDFVMPGLNYRLTNIQAALGTVQIDMFDDWVKIRSELQNEYRLRIKSEWVGHPIVQAGHTWQSYMVVLDKSIDRSKLIEQLREKGVESNYGAYSVLDTKYYKDKYGEHYPLGMPMSSHLYRHGLCLPLHQGLTIQDIQEISKIFIETINHR